MNYIKYFTLLIILAIFAPLSTCWHGKTYPGIYTRNIKLITLCDSWSPHSQDTRKLNSKAKRRKMVWSGHVTRPDTSPLTVPWREGDAAVVRGRIGLQTGRRGQVALCRTWSTGREWRALSALVLTSPPHTHTQYWHTTGMMLFIIYFCK